MVRAKARCLPMRVMNTFTPPVDLPAASTRRGPVKWGWAGGVGLALILACLGWAEWRGWPWLAAPLETHLSERFHHPIRFHGGMALHLWGHMRLHVGQLEIGQPTWLKRPADAGPMLSAEQFDAVVPYVGIWQAMLHRQADALYIDKIELNRVTAHLTRDRLGLANWSLDEPGRMTAPTGDVLAIKLPHVEHLTVNQGQLDLDDEALALNMKARLSTAEGEAGGAGLHVDGEGHYKGHPFEMHVAASGALPLLTQPLTAPPVPILIRAQAGASRLQFDGTTRDLLKLGKLEGQLLLNGPSLAAMGDTVGVTLPTTAPFALTGVIKKDGDLWALQMQSLKVGASRLRGAFTLDRRPRTPLLQGALSGSQLALADLAPAFGAATNGAPNPKPPSGHVLPQREFDVPSLRAMDARVRLRIQRASLGAWFAQPFEPLDADLQLQSGVLKITDLVARAAGGSLGGSLRLDGNGAMLLWDAKLNWSGIRLENWLNAPDKRLRKAEAPSTYVSGQLAGKADLHGEGNSTARLLGSLDGTAMMWIQEGEVSRLMVEAASLHVAEALGLFIVGDTREPLQCAVARMTAKQGQLTPEVAIVDTPSATIIASGTISLAEEKLALTLTSHPKSLSPLSLRTPVDVRGSFSEPSVRLHPRPLGMKVLAAAALSVAAPLAALIPLVDVGQAQHGGCAQALQAMRAPSPNPHRSPTR